MYFSLLNGFLYYLLLIFSIKTLDVNSTDKATDQTIVGPEESASYQLKTDENINVQPVDVKQDQNVNLEENDLQNTDENANQ